LVLLGYFLIPSRFKNLFLLIASIVFYAIGEAKLVILLSFVILVSYFSGIVIEKGYRKLGLWMSVGISLAVLFYFKYTNFLYDSVSDMSALLGLGQLKPIAHIALPIGISFFTFQGLSYSIDVYRRDVKASRSLIDFATYKSFFPQLIAGPIVRYVDVSKQLTDRKVTISDFALGAERFILGLAKKVIIANHCAYIADTIFHVNPDYISTGSAWIGVIFYTLQIYFDFSGYSDMAIGLARMFGFRFLENFDYPYLSTTIREFWRRWHISLSSWFRDYLYIPLGGSRKGKIRTYFNLLIIFLATGVWHGASWNFVIWGLWHGIFMMIERLGFEKLLSKTFKIFGHIYAMGVVVLGFVIFRTDNMSLAASYMKRIFGISNNYDLTVYTSSYFFTFENIFIFVLAIIFCMPVFPYFRKKLDSIFSRKSYTMIFYYAFLLILLLLVMMKLTVDTYNPFIYFRF